MNKSEFISAIAEKTGLTKKDAEKAVIAFTDTVGEELAKGEKIQLVGFGTFERVDKPARNGLNPKTKEVIKISASKSPKFRPGASLKQSIQ